MGKREAGNSFSGTSGFGPFGSGQSALTHRVGQRPQQREGAANVRMITVNRPVTLSEAAGALKARLGGSYKITPHGGGSRETIDINHAGQLAAVRLVHNDNSTTFRVHGRGVIIGLAVRESVIARRVSKAPAEALNSTTPN